MSLLGPAVPGIITDPIALLGYLFLGTEAPECLAACAASGDEASPPDIADAVLMLNVLFLGARPAVPVPSCEAVSEPGSCAGADCGG